MALRKTQKLEAIGKLTGGIAHDFNNILHTIKGFSRLIEKSLTKVDNVTITNKVSGYLKDITYSIDRGSGIEEEDLSKIFDPFFTTKESEGTGLGLNMVYGFMSRSNGTIDVKSTPGEGTCFSLFFPRELSNTEIN